MSHDTEISISQNPDIHAQNSVPGVGFNGGYEMQNILTCSYCSTDIYFAMIYIYIKQVCLDEHIYSIKAC